MKKIFTLLFVGAFCLGMAQLPVSQTVQNKKVVLEEHTGKTCTFCPDGHKRANELKDANPGNVFLINIHEGGYAAGTPNYRTTFGPAIASQSQLEGYPAGAVNRTNFPGYEQTNNQGVPVSGIIAQGRGTWATTASIVLGESSYVNVALDAEIDVVTNLLTVNVEAYYTGSSPQANNKLNVAITQDEIWGPQTGASSYYPENIDPATGLYKHSHMLRHLMTGQWGDLITNTAAGTLFSRTYTYTLPAIIGDVPMDISKLNIVAFVTETNEKIISAGDGKPVLTNLPNNLEAEMISLTAPDYTCDGVVEPSFNVRNYGAQDITSMRIGYSVNGGTQYIYNWTGGPILPGYNLDITMPLVGFPVAASNDLDVTIEKVNGDTDDVPGNNSAMASISGVEEHITNSVVVEVTPDNYASEIGWKLYDANGSVVDSVATGTWANGDLMVQTKTLTLNTLDCYSLELEDTYGDGLLAPGKIELKDGSGAVLYTLTGSYSTSEYKFATVDAAGNGNGNGDGSSVNPSGIRDLNKAFTFGLFPNPANDVLNVSFDDQVKEIKIINLLGEVVITADLKQIDVAELSSGVYFVSVVDSQGREVSQSFVKK